MVNGSQLNRCNLNEIVTIAAHSPTSCPPKWTPSLDSGDFNSFWSLSETVEISAREYSAPPNRVRISQLRGYKRFTNLLAVGVNYVRVDSPLKQLTHPLT